MKGVSKLIPVILTFFLLIFTVSLVNASSNNYDFKIVVSYNFDDDEEINCDLTINGDEEKSIDFSDSRKEYTNDFADTLEMDCNENLDKIKLYIYDENGDEVDKDSWTDEDKFDYEADLVDEDENWFEIEIVHEFGSSDIDCDLKVDSKTYSYKFDEDTDNDDLIIKKNFDEDIEFSCDDEFDKIRFRAYDDDGDDLEDKTYEDKDGFDYNLDESNAQNEMKIELDHDFDKDSEIKCTLELDNDNKETFTFDEDSTSSDLKIVRDFEEKIEFDCNDDIDEIKLYIYDDDGDKVVSETYENDDGFDYKFNAGDYEFFIQIDELTSTKEIDCTLYLDGNKEDKFTFDDSSSIGDRRIENDFKENFELICGGALNGITLMVFTAEDIDGKEGDKIFEKIYSKTDKIGYDVGNSYIVEEEKEEVPIQEVNVVQEIEKKPVVQTPVVVEPTLNSSQITGSVDVQSGQKTDTNKATVSSSEKVPIVDNSVKDNVAIEESTSFSSIMFALLLILFGIIVIVLILMKMGIIEYDNPKKRHGYRKAAEKKDIDFDFLKKKK